MKDDLELLLLPSPLLEWWDCRRGLRETGLDDGPQGVPHARQALLKLCFFNIPRPPFSVVFKEFLISKGSMGLNLTGNTESHG